MRILHVAAANSLQGGGEKHVADLITELARRGYDIALVAPEGGDLKRITDEVGVRYYPAPIASGYSPARVKAVRKAIEDFGPDIVHAHGHRAAMFARLADRQASRRVVYTLHGIHVGRGMLAPVKTAIERKLLDRTAHFITTCASDVKKAEALGIIDPEKLAVVYNGTPDPVFTRKGVFREELKIAESTPLVLTIARISPPKNLPFVVDAFDEACAQLDKTDKQLPMLAMVCPGRNDQRKRLQAHIDAHAYAGRIRLLEGRPDLSSAYTDADLFVLGSLWEARPYVLVEAMSYGLPVVSTDIDGVAEAVISGADGLLTPPGDRSAFASAVVEFVEDAGKRKDFGRHAATSTRGRNTIAGMVDRIEEVYHGILEA